MLNALEAVVSVTSSPRRIGIATVATPTALLVRVVDSGAGFGREDADRLFEPFFTTKAGGMGMGLVISRNIIEAHGGQIWASREDGETRFQFTLPWAKAPA
jgi:C4-dicarboxylate-specific signal transduction histidine kinase